MKKTVRIWTIPLLLMLLSAIFAVTAFAAEDTATVVYPDGTEATYAVGETILPPAAENGLYHGKGNTLFKDDAAEGWYFTAEGESEPLTGLAVTSEMAGKRILASGFDKVYYTSVERVASGTVTVYHLQNDLHTYFGASNKGDRGDGTNVGAHSYLELRKTTTESVTVTVYEDVVCSSFAMNWKVETNAFDGRPCYLDLNGHSVTNTQSSYIDLMGIFIYIYSSKEGAHWYQPNSKNGLCRPNDNGTLYLGDDGSGAFCDNISFHVRQVIYDAYGSGAYILGGRYYQTGTSKYGGLVEIGRRLKEMKNASFYAYPGQTLLTASTGLDGTNVGTGTTAIKNCTFYAESETALLSSEKAVSPRFSGCYFVNVTMDVTAGGTATLSYTTGNYTNTPPRYNVGKAGTSVYCVRDAEAKEVPLTLSDGTETTAALYYRTAAVEGGVTVTYPDGTSELRLIGETLSFRYGAPAYTENGVLYAKTAETQTFTLADGTPIGDDLAKEALIGKTVYATSNPTYAPAFFSVAVNGAVTYHTDGSTYADALTAYLAEMENGATVTLYSDVTLSPLTVAGKRCENKNEAEGAAFALDLNGHTVTFTGSGVALRVLAPDFYLYSSVKGGQILAPAHALFVTDKDDYKWIGGIAYGAGSAGYLADEAHTPIQPCGFLTLGEREADAVQFGENLRVVCASVNRELLYGGAALLGGTYIQSEDIAAPYFVYLSHTEQNLLAITRVERVTVVLRTGATAVMYYRSAADICFKDCRFLSTDAVAPLLSAENTALPSDPVFEGCDFYNILPARGIGSRTFTYTDCAFGFASAAPAQDLDPTQGVAYLVGADTARDMTVEGVTYTLDHTLRLSDYPLVTVQYPDGACHTYAVGESIQPYMMADTRLDGKNFYKLVGEGWTYSLSGTPIEGNTVPAEAAGKTLYATGYEYKKVYYTSLEQTAQGSVLVYHLVGDLNVYLSTENLGDRGNGTNSGASSYEELRKTTTTKVTVTLYEDFTLDFLNPSWYDEDVRIGGRPVYLNLNGHTVNLLQASDMLIMGMKLYIYSTVAGAEWHHEKAEKMFRVDNDATLYLGGGSASTTNHENITFFGKSLFVSIYGGGVYIYGGIYRQSAPATVFVEIARRIYAIENADFYLAEGSVALFGDTAAAAYSSLALGTESIKNCTFHAPTPVFKIYAIETGTASPAFKDCTLEGIIDATAGGETEILLPNGEKLILVLDDSITPPDAAKMYTDANGILFGLVKEGWYLVDGEGARVHSLKITPEMIGKSYTLVPDHIYSEVLYTVECGDKTEYNVNRDTYALDFMLLMSALPSGARVTLYADITVDALRVIGTNGRPRMEIEYGVQYLDLNGHTLTVSGSGSSAIDVRTYRFYLYSSKAGAQILASDYALASAGTYDYTVASGASLTVAGHLILGEAEDGASLYGKNLSIRCRSVLGNSDGGKVSLFGITLRQSDALGGAPFLCINNSGELEVRDAIFLLTGRTELFLYETRENVTFTGCTFVNMATELVQMFKPVGVTVGSPIFHTCDFFHIYPSARVGATAVAFEGCAFGFIGTPETEISSEAVLTVTPSRTLMVDGRPYIVSYTLTAQSKAGCTVVYPDGSSQIFAVGETILPMVRTQLYTGKDGNAYVCVGDGWTFTLNGTALSDLTVTSAMVGKTVNATGYARVYFTVEVDGNLTSYTNASTYASDFKAYLAQIEQGATVRLYADVAVDQLIICGKRLSDAALMTSASYMLDLNGHTLTFTGSGTTMDILTAKFYLYSSVEGGRIAAEKQVLFISNNDDYKWVNGAAVLAGSTAYKNSSEKEIKPTATVYIGELALGATAYGKNLTVVCAAVNKDMYGTGAYFCGGTFVQSASSAAEYFLLLSRTGSAGAHIKGVENTTFVTVKSTTAFLNYNAANAVDFVNCRFISTAGAVAPLFTERESIASAPAFRGCLFYDVLPKISVNLRIIEYKNCTFGFSGSVPTEDMDEGSNMMAYFAPADTKQCTVQNTVYSFNLTPIVSKLGFCTVYYPDGSHAIFYVGESIAPFTEEKTFLSGGHLYADLGAGWQYTLDGASLSDLTVTENMIGKSVYATGYMQVYFYVEVNGAYTYYTSADTYAADLKGYLGAMDAGARIVLCEDVSLPSLYAYGKRIADKDTVMNAEYRLDLNGKTLTFTGSGTALTVRAAKFYLYSSVEGAKVLCESHIFINSDNDDYKWIDGAAYSSSSTTYKNAATVSPIKPSAIVVIGEADINASQYGDYLTVVCAQVNEALHGTGVAFRGGRFVQSANSTAAYFFYLSRTPLGDADIRTVSDVTLVLSNPKTAFMSGNFTDTMNIRDCSFVSTSGTVPFFHREMTASPRLSFTCCAFYDGILPARLGTHTVTYSDCAFGFSGFVTVIGDLRIAHTAQKVYAEGYALDCRTFTELSEVCTVLWGDAVTEYWMLGTVPYCTPSLLDRVAEHADGSAYLTSGAIINSADLCRITESMLGTERTIPVSYLTVLPVAFTYTDTAGNMNYVLIPDGASASAIGDLFHTAFNTCNGAYTIKLHSDILLTKALGWGPAGTQDGVLEYKSLQNGSVTLDLNGFALTVAADCTTINASNANSSSYPKIGHGIFAFEINTSSTFTLTSSRPGARIVNLSSTALFTVGEQANITLVIEGENLAIESNGVIFYSFETHSSKMTQLRVNGGTYTYNGTAVAIAWVGDMEISDAEIYVGANAKYIFGAHYWKRSTDLSVTDTLICCAGGSTALFSFVTSSMTAIAANMVTGVTHSLSLTDCVCLGFSLPTAIENVSSLTYDGVALTDPAVLLALYGGTAPEGTSLAFLERTVLSTTYRLYAYLTDAKVGTVDWGFGLPTEIWKLGETASRPNAVIGGVFGYAFLPTLVDAQTVKGGCRLASLRPDTLRMSLTLQGTIGLNLFLSESLGASSVTVAGITYTLADMKTQGGFYTFVASVSPNLAHIPVTVEILVGEYTHAVPVSIEQYAAAILKTDAYAAVHDLTYAMVRHVEAQTGTRFARCEAPIGYRRAKPVPVAHANTGTLLDSIAFLPDGTISIALRGQVGTAVQLSLACGRREYRVMTEGVVIFDKIYINEFFGDMTVRASKDGKTEVYTYSLENYLYYQTDPALIEKIELLYNYTYYAHLYVDTLAGVRVDADSDHICDLCQKSRSAHTDADADGLCDHCGGTPDWSVGLVFAENADGTYTVTGMGDCTDASLRIPATYLGKPVSAIGANAFAGASVRSVLLPDSIRQIGANAFKGCTALQILSVGSGLASIGENAFADCAALSTVYYNGRATGFAAIAGGDALSAATVFYYSEHLPSTDGYFWCYGADGSIFIYCKDLDHDHLCDDCGVTLTVCRDDDRNHLCDICGTALSVCADENRDHLCDTCAAELSVCLDADSDHLCDVCGTALSVCINGDGDHFCDFCGERITPCVDNNRDHVCEICGESANGCIDPDENHFCDICDATVSLCKDENRDHLCDICLQRLSYHADTDSDHLCDLCHGAVTACADLDGDHICDLCAKDFGDCADADHDHLCDACGATISDHADAEGDHVCDLCGATLAHVDLDGDHACEICGTVSDCTDGDGDHLCDACGKRITDCADADHDHLCDLCKETLTDHADASGDHLCDVCALRISDCKDTDSDHRCDGCGAVLSFCCDDGNTRCALCGRLLASAGLRYRLKSDGTYTVTGIGDCKDSYIYIPKYYNGVAVTGIAGAAFAARREIIGVSIPDSVETIGLAAFAGCVNLSELRVGNGVKEIPFAAFSLCMNLRSVTLGDGVETIGLGAFADCMSLESIRFGSGLRTIQLGAFAGCLDLETVALPEGLEVIGLGAFSGCKAMKSVCLPESTVRIGHAAFDRQTALESIYYAGTQEGFDAISVADKNIPMLDADLYFYTAAEPAGQGRFWYYDASGAIVYVTLCPVHTDENHDLFCDLCAERMTCAHALDAIGSCLWCNYFACVTHKDYNRDFACDLCGTEMMACAAHADANVDSLCDICGAPFSCTAHADTDTDGFCDSCSLLMQDMNFAWESETVTFEMSNHSNEGMLTSRGQSFMAGDIIFASAVTSDAILARNAAAYEATRVSVDYRYLPEFNSDYTWAKNYERIAVMQESGNYADIYCNFGYDMLGASLLGCFANLKTDLEQNHFNFAVNEFYAETVGDSEGYMYEYMRSLAFDEDRMYLLASDYFIDLVRAFYAVPVNAAMLEEIGAYDILGLGRENTAQDLAAAALDGRFTYETILRYSAVFGDVSAASDAVGFALAEDPLSAAGLLYTSSVPIFDGMREEKNDPFYAFADSLSRLMRAKGVLSVKENGIASVRERFTGGGALFGGVVLLGNLEIAPYRDMSDGVLILPVPVHIPGVAYATRIHDVGRIGAISAKTEKFGPVSAFLNYQSTHSGAVLASYFENDLVVGALAASDALREANLSILAMMREHVGPMREQAIDSAASILAGHMHAVSPAGDVTYASLRWQDILAAEHYDSTFVRSYARMLREEKLRTMRYIYLNGATSLPR